MICNLSKKTCLGLCAVLSITFSISLYAMNPMEEGDYDLDISDFQLVISTESIISNNPQQNGSRVEIDGFYPLAKSMSQACQKKIESYFNIKIIKASPIASIGAYIDIFNEIDVPGMESITKEELVKLDVINKICQAMTKNNIPKTYSEEAQLLEKIILTEVDLATTDQEKIDVLKGLLQCVKALKQVFDDIDLATKKGLPSSSLNSFLNLSPSLQSFIQKSQKNKVHVGWQELMLFVSLAKIITVPGIFLCAITKSFFLLLDIAHFNQEAFTPFGIETLLKFSTKLQNKSSLGIK